MKNMSIKFLSFVILIFIAIYGSFVIYSAITISRNINEAEVFWLKYQDISSTRTSAYNSIAKAMGYGGMIHHFKNYVLRKDTPRIAKVRVAAGEALASIEQYTETALTPDERNALRDIRSVVQAYAKNIELARQLVAEGKDASQIDKAVKINDGPALRGLAVLKAQIKSHKMQKDAQTNRVELLGEFNRALGFGGMIHQFKNYVLRQDAPRVGKVKRAIMDLQAAVDKYKSFPIRRTEETSLKSMLGVVQQYRDNLDLVTKLASEGKTPEEIDDQVKINDQPALSALRIPRMEVSNTIEVSKRRTTGHLANTTKFSQSILIGSAAGLALLMLLISYVQFSHVLGPINKISKSLAQFIDGDLDIDFYGVERKDELGYLARVIDKLRLILISYALRQTGNGKRGQE
jgi:hypothetical protein